MVSDIDEFERNVELGSEGDLEILEGDDVAVDDHRGPDPQVVDFQLEGRDVLQPTLHYHVVDDGVYLFIQVVLLVVVGLRLEPGLVLLELLSHLLDHLAVLVDEELVVVDLVELLGDLVVVLVVLGLVELVPGLGELVDLDEFLLFGQECLEFVLGGLHSNYYNIIK